MRLRDYEALLTVDPSGQPMRHDEVRGYRTKATYAGNALEIDAYPIVRLTPKAREAMQKGLTSEAQRIVNARNRERRLRALAEANFGPEDLFLTMTYEGNLPNYAQAQKDMREFVKKIRKRLRKEGKELKYIYALGYETEGDRRVRIHGHIIMTGMDRDEAEAIWQQVHAGRVNSRRLQPNEKGLAELMGYFLGQHKKGKTWVPSKNLTQPTVKTSDRKLSRRRVERMARELRVAGKEIFEKLYPEYRLVEDVVLRTSDVMPGAYIYARMMRRDGGARESSANAAARAGQWADNSILRVAT